MKLPLFDLNRHTTEEEWEWLRAIPYHYAPHFPLSLIPEYRRRGRRRWLKHQWGEEFIESVRRDGIQNPIIVNNSPREYPNPFTEHRVFDVRAGNHRVLAAQMLGHTTIPAIIWGASRALIDGEWKHVPITWPSFDTEGANKLINDGVIELKWFGPHLEGARLPRECK